MTAQAESDRLANAVRGAAAIASLVPGVAILAKLVELPIEADRVAGGISLAGGAVVVLAVIACRRWIASLRLGVFLALALGSFAVGGVFSLLQYDFGVQQIIGYEDFDTQGRSQDHILVKPLRPSPELSEILAEFGGDYGAAVHSPQYGQRAIELIRRDGVSAVILYIAYLLMMQSFLLFAVIVGAWRSANFFGRAQETD